MPRAKDDFELHIQQKQENTYQKRRKSFIASNDLQLRPQYLSELKSNPHIYPHSNTEVKYMTPQERKRTEKPMFFGKLFDKLIQSLRGPKEIQLDQPVMFTRRGSVRDLMMMEKHEVHRHHDRKLKSNHSTFNQGMPVANAGFLRFNRKQELTSVELSSGHYGPDHASGVKLAMWAKEEYAFDANKVPIYDSNGQKVDVSEKKRVEVVNSWAASHPFSTSRRKSF